MPFTFPYYYESHCLAAGNSPLLILIDTASLCCQQSLPCHCLNAVYIPLPLQKSLPRCRNSPLLIINDTPSLSTVPSSFSVLGFHPLSVFQQLPMEWPRVSFTNSTQRALRLIMKVVQSIQQTLRLKKKKKKKKK